MNADTFESLGANLWRRGPHYYGRFRVAGRRNRRWKRLAAIKQKEAREEIAQLQARHDQAAAGLLVGGQPAADPFTRATAAAVTVATLLEQWRELGAPDHHGDPRSPERLREIDIHLPRLTQYLGARAPASLAVADCHTYHDARLHSPATTETTATTARFTGRRSIDMELTTLSNCLSWAASRGRIQANPIGIRRPRFQRDKHVRHAPEVMPQSGDAFHAIANWMFSCRRTEVFGWMVLVAGVTGCRVSEIMRLRTDAQRLGAHAGPGFTDGRYLYIDRSKRGVFPWVPLVDPELPENCPSRDILAGLLAQHRRWCQWRYPTHDWYFPGRLAGLPVSGQAMNHALTDACKALGIPHVTPHGLRAYYVNTCRRWGMTDTIIAQRLGDRTGAAIIERVYGAAQPAYDNALDWLPTTEPIAWHAFDEQLPAPNKILTLKTA